MINAPYIEETIPMANVTKMMNNAGYAFNYKSLEDMKNKYPSISELISDSNEDYITLGTMEPEIDLGEPDEDQEDMTPEQPPMPEMPQSDMAQQQPQTTPQVDIDDGRNPERQTVDKMAARAARF